MLVGFVNLEKKTAPNLVIMHLLVALYRCRQTDAEGETAAGASLETDLVVGPPEIMGIKVRHHVLEKEYNAP